MTHSLSAGIWRLADPKISLASMASMFLATCAAARDGPIAWGWLAVTVVGIFAIEVAKNASGEIFDFDSGTDLAVAPEDRSPFSGGKRVLVDGLLTRQETAAIAAVGYALGAAFGLGIVLLREPRVLGFGLAGMACAFFYHAPPLRLSYRGWGELAVAVCYGPLICGGTYLVQRRQLPFSVLALSVPLGLLVAAFLWVNEFPDFAADGAAGKRNLVVCLGRDRAAAIFPVLLSAAFLALLALPLAGLSGGVWLGLLAIVPAFLAARRLRAARGKTAEMISAQKEVLLAFLLLAAGSGVGLWIFG